MPETMIKDLKMRLELLQEKVWNNEEKIGQNLDCIAKHESELKRLKKLAELVQYEFATLEKDIVQMKEKGGSK